LSLLIYIYMWKPYFLFRWGFRLNVLQYVYNLGKGITLLFVPILLVIFIPDFIHDGASYIDCINALIKIVIYSVISFLSMISFSKYMRSFVLRIIKSILK